MFTTRRSFLAAAAAGIAPRPLSIDWRHAAQPIDGFGVSGAFHMAANLQRLPEAEQQRVLDLLFSPERGAGFSIVRSIVGDGGLWGSPADGPTPTIEPSPGVWNWTGDEDQIWFMREAVRRGAGRFLSTVWSPPAWMKSNGSVSGGGALDPQHYQAFAEYLSAYVRGYRRHHGIDIYAVSPANEPTLATPYSSCQWTADQLHQFVKHYLLPVFDRDRVSAKLVLGEDTHWSEALLLPTLADPQVAARLDIVAAHAYSDSTDPFPPLSTRTGRFAVSDRLGKRIWQTEASAGTRNITGIEDGLYWARLLHTHLAENRVSAWFYWWGMNHRDTRSGLIRMLLDEGRAVAARRLFTLGQYSRFVRPGDERLECPAAAVEGVFVSAFRSRSRRSLTIVAINQTASPQPLEIRIRGLRCRDCHVWRTSATEALQPVESPALARDRWQARLEPASVTTYVVGGA